MWTSHKHIFQKSIHQLKGEFFQNHTFIQEETVSVENSGSQRDAYRYALLIWIEMQIDKCAESLDSKADLLLNLLSLLIHLLSA